MDRRNRVAGLLARMASSSAAVDRMISRAKAGGKVEAKPVAEPEPSAPAGLGDGIRVYTVTDWRPTCSRCSRQGRCGESQMGCENVSWFPISHRVTLTVVGGEVVWSVCREGVRGDKGGCRDGEDCRHADRAIKFLRGEEAKGVELSMSVGSPGKVPVCPVCRQNWCVSPSSVVGKSWECRGPVCERDGEPWRFDEGDASRPAPMRHSLVIMDRDPGRVVVKREG
jgi:hypothetical protein